MKMQNCGVFCENNSNNGLKAHTIILNFAFYILHFKFQFVGQVDRKQPQEAPAAVGVPKISKSADIAVILCVEATLEADHQAACLCIEAA